MLYALRLLVCLLESEHCCQIILDDCNHASLRKLMNSIERIHEHLANDENSLDIEYLVEMQQQCDRLMSILQPFVVLTDQGFEPFVHILDNFLGHKPLMYVLVFRFIVFLHSIIFFFVCFRFAGNYGISLKYFNLDHSDMKQNVELDKEPLTKLYSINCILKILIDVSSCPNIMQLLSYIQFLDMIPTLLKGFIEFHKQDWSQEYEQEQCNEACLSNSVASNEASNNNNNNSNTSNKSEPLQKVESMPAWFETVSKIDLTEEEEDWIDRSQILTNICANSLKLCYLFFIYRKQCGVKRNCPQIAKLLFDLLSVIGTRIYLFDPNFDQMGCFSDTQNNGEFYVNIIERLRQYWTVNSSTSNIDNNIATKSFGLLCECLSGLFAFTLCDECENKVNNINNTDLLLYEDHCWQLEKYFDYLAFKPHLFVLGLKTLHECLIHVKALKLEKNWRKKFESEIMLEKVRKLSIFALSNDATIHRLLPCVMVQLSQFGAKVTQVLFEPLTELFMSRFIPV